jgi:hypothetical protein
MKKLLIVMISLALAGSVSAQHFSHGGGTFYRPHVIVTGGFYPYYGFGFGSPFYPYYPYGYYNGYNRPSKMTMKIEDIKSDYKDKIWSAKHDTSLTHKERRQKVRELKHQRDNAIDDLKRNYYKH